MLGEHELVARYFELAEIVRAGETAEKRKGEGLILKRGWRRTKPCASRRTKLPKRASRLVRVETESGGVVAERTKAPPSVEGYEDGFR